MTLATPTLGMPDIIRTDDHRYIYEQVTYPGTTGILKECLGASFEQAAKYGATNAAKAALHMHQAGALQALLDSTGPDGFIKALADRHRWERDQAAQLGSAVHTLAEKPAGDDEHPDGAVMARVRAYRDWWRNSGWTKPLTEVIGVNPSVGYGGTLDLMARDEQGRLTLADIKTGSVWREAVLQVTAYGDFTVILVNGKLSVMPKVDRYVILAVTNDGVRPIDVEVGQAEHMAWLDCVDLYRWTKKVKGRL